MKTAEEIFESICLENDPNGNWTLEQYKTLAAPMLENIVEAMKAYAQQPAVSEDKLSEIFANHADNTPYLNFTAFKEAVKELLNPKR